MTSRLFGTDGVRGLANGDLTPEVATQVAIATAHVLGAGSKGPRPRVLLGRDPRASGEMLEAAVAAGCASAGADVMRVGVLPTPAVAQLTAETDADFGVMLSASHNPMPDNGIKVFARGGHKLPDQIEVAIETALENNQQRHWTRPVGAGLGRISDLTDGAARYLDHLARAVPVSAAGLRVVVDCAHGAASAVAPAAYRKAGATVIPIAAAPDGYNINDGVGSTHMEGLQQAVVAHGADLGLAHDGDADRCLAVDADGQLIDGDQILALLAVGMRQAGTLAQNTLVVTVMSNLGLLVAMREAGITVATTAVGDRYVLEELRQQRLSLGGEQSGHVVFPAHATTGDGILTGLSVLARMAATGAGLAELGRTMNRMPQALINVRVKDKAGAVNADGVRAAVDEVERELGDDGRVLLRPSGTENLVRVMVEAASPEMADDTASRIADAVRSTGV